MAKPIRRSLRSQAGQRALLRRLEAACVVSAIGATFAGARTVETLMGRMNCDRASVCNREAAAILNLIVAGLLEVAPPLVIERISKAIAERESFVEGPE